MNSIKKRLEALKNKGLTENGGGVEDLPHNHIC